MPICFNIVDSIFKGAILRLLTVDPTGRDLILIKQIAEFKNVIFFTAFLY